MTAPPAAPARHHAAAPATSLAPNAATPSAPSPAAEPGAAATAPDDPDAQVDPGFETEAAEDLFMEPVMVDGVSVAVAENQHATVFGETESLRAVVEEICRQARIDLRAYGAPDRRYVGKIENVPLTDAFRSILRTESYLVWLQASTDGEAPRVKWMRVLGTEGTGAMPMAPSVAAQFAAPRPNAAVAPPPPPARFSMSTALLFQAFGTFDPVRRDQAQREIIERISQPDQMQRFLSTDTSLLVSMFGRYRDSELTLARLKSLTDRPEVQAKFDEILSQMAAEPETPAANAPR